MQTEFFVNVFLSISLGNSEEHSSLSRALSQLAEVEEKMEQIHVDQVPH